MASGWMGEGLGQLNRLRGAREGGEEAAQVLSPQQSPCPCPGPARCHRPDGAHTEQRRGPAEGPAGSGGADSAPVPAAPRPPALPRTGTFLFGGGFPAVTRIARHLEGKGH